MCYNDIIMNDKQLQDIVVEYQNSHDKVSAVEKVTQVLADELLRVVEVNVEKPWGAYIRLDNNDAERFATLYFPSISYDDAKLGNENAELSPKILIVEPGKRLSWQKHARRAECWTFLTDGSLYRSDTDELGTEIISKAGDFVQLQAGERHRLVGDASGLTVVAEIWQHVDSDNLSDEDDITRIQDDFSR